jgi:hypothetical protein
LTLPMSPLTPQTKIAPAATSSKLTPIPISDLLSGPVCYPALQPFYPQRRARKQSL